MTDPVTAAAPTAPTETGQTATPATQVPQTPPGTAPTAAPQPTPASPTATPAVPAATPVPTPAATDPSAEAAPARAPRPTGSPLRRPLISGTSLAELLATGGERPEEQAGAEETALPADIPVDPACESKLQQAREQILNLIRERRPRFVPAFEQMVFRGHTIAVSVPTAELREEILRNKTAMLTRIAELAGISGALELEVTVNEEIRAARPIKLEDRVKYMTDKNPLLAEFRKALDLEVE